MSSCAVIIVAAGTGQRFGDKLPKQYHLLNDKMILQYSLAAFAAHPLVSSVTCVINPDYRDLYDECAKDLNLREPVCGGKSRQESVLAGLTSIEDLNPDIVLIHDGARPFVSYELIERIITSLDDNKAVIPALPVSETLKRSHYGFISETVSRENLYSAQTPQGFDFKAIFHAHQQTNDQEFTDDAVIAEKAGIKVAIIEGDYKNIKITSKDDLLKANNFFAKTPEIKTGFGFDVHSFGTGKNLYLCGVEIPHSKGLLGHSDADVALHAITDALLGAIGAGDIGLHFPPSDNRWRGASSDIFLKKAIALINGLGGKINNIDVTIICERPKITPYRHLMTVRLSELTNVPQKNINIKGTTTEKLGFTGREEGIAAQAVATISII